MSKVETYKKVMEMIRKYGELQFHQEISKSLDVLMKLEKEIARLSF